MLESKFEYAVDLTEMVPDKKGGQVPRYGRLRDPAMRHLGADAPFLENGALYDRLNVGRMILPINGAIKGEAPVSGIGRMTESPNRLAFCPAPGVSAYGD